MKQTRQLLVTLIGHVDHGKTKIADAIRGTSVAEKEPGLITQAISFTNLPFSHIEKITSHLLKDKKISIPGLVFIDTPGHAAFINLRKRGGNLADIAILVIDINEGLKPQTLEAIDILKTYKTPFIIAANKIDLIFSFQKKEGTLLQILNQQPETFKKQIEEKLYRIVGDLSTHNLNAERFDRVEDYTKQVAIIPISAKVNIGIPELLMVLTGLAQKFLESSLKVNLDSPGKGIILEVKETKGIGTTLDTILYDGKIKVKDQIVIASLEKPIVTKVKSILIPEDPKSSKLKSVEEVKAALGIKISAPDIKEVISGMPLQVANFNLEQVKKEIQKEIKEVLIETDSQGIIIKADSLGSLEALTSLLKQDDIKIRKATIGNINKTDIAEASAAESNLNKVILGFNVSLKTPKEDVTVITNNVIYKIVEDYESWLKKESRKEQESKLQKLLFPGKIQILPGTIFRQSNPAVVGITVIQGSVTTNTPLMKEDGTHLVAIKTIQIEGEPINKVEQGKQAAIALQGVTVGRQIDESDILYTDIPEDDFKKLKEMKTLLNPSQINLLKEISQIKRKRNSMWGI